MKSPEGSYIALALKLVVETGEDVALALQITPNVYAKYRADPSSTPLRHRFQLSTLLSIKADVTSRPEFTRSVAEGLFNLSQDYLASELAPVYTRALARGATEEEAQNEMNLYMVKLLGGDVLETTIDNAGKPVRSLRLLS